MSLKVRAVGRRGTTEALAAGRVRDALHHPVGGYEVLPLYGPGDSVAGFERSTAAQELAYTLADGFAYVELGLDRGLDIEAFAPA